MIVVDCVQQVLPQSFDHVDHLESLEIQISNMITVNLQLQFGFSVKLWF